MESTVVLSFDQAESLASQALRDNGANVEIASCVAHALALADADAQTSHGLERIPSYVGQLRSGKVSGNVSATGRQVTPSGFEVQANGGFAYPAIDLAIENLTDICPKQGIAAAGIVGSHHCGVMGHPVEKLARAGFIGLMFANTPKAMAVFGGRSPLLGTNPIAFACPRAADKDPLIIDTSLSAVARGKIVSAAKRGDKVPDDWGVNASGEPTCDPNEILKGCVNPLGGAKGGALALMVEMLAGAFVRSNFGFQASSFFDGEGGSPNVGQLILCLNAGLFNHDFGDHVELLLQEIQQNPISRIPGARRIENRQKAMRDGLGYSTSLIDSILSTFTKNL